MKINRFIVALTCLLLLHLTTSFGQKIEKLGSAVNTEYNEIHPLIAPDANTLYFVRVSHPTNNFGKDGSNDVWYTEYRNNRWDIARRMPNSINKDRYNDVFSITPDGNTMLIRGAYERGRKLNEVGISLSKKNDRGWSQPEQVDVPKLASMCKGYYLSAYLSNNGKVMMLAFSDKKKSNKDDIYISFMDKKGEWSMPENLGSDVNTAGVETTPFLASDNQTLYFASDRKGGQGGLDIWVTKRKNRFWNSWAEPQNLGSVINSDEDDYYYSIAANGQYAYMATKKEAVGMGDIVRFKLYEDQPQDADQTITSIAEPTAEDAENPAGSPSGENATGTPSLTAPTPVVMLSGKVIDQKTGKPLDAKIIYETLPDGEEAGVAYTDPKTGEYKIVLPYGSKYSVRAVAKDFIAIGRSVDLTEIKQYKEVTGQELKMVPIEIGLTVALNNIFFEFGKATLTDDSFPELNRIAGDLEERSTLVIEIQGHTDNVGSDEANLTLSQARADAVRSSLLGKRIPENQVRSVGFGESRPIASNANPAGQAQNRRVEFVIVRK
jgi:outer membrane protein OmpA-like peptidoglycan-associated protein